MWARCSKLLETLLVIFESINVWFNVYLYDCVISMYIVFVFFVSSVVGDIDV